jgi:hypothetical protein
MSFGLIQKNLFDSIFLKALISDVFLHIIPQIIHIESKSDEKLVKDFVPYYYLILACESMFSSH